MRATARSAPSAIPPACRQRIAIVAVRAARAREEHEQRAKPIPHPTKYWYVTRQYIQEPPARARQNSHWGFTTRSSSAARLASYSSKSLSSPSLLSSPSEEAGVGRPARPPTPQPSSEGKSKKGFTAIRTRVAKAKKKDRKSKRSDRDSNAGSADLRSAALPLGHQTVFLRGAEASAIRSSIKGW